MLIKHIVINTRPLHDGLGTHQEFNINLRDITGSLVD